MGKYSNSTMCMFTAHVEEHLKLMLVEMTVMTSKCLPLNFSHELKRPFLTKNMDKLISFLCSKTI